MTPSYLKISNMYFFIFLSSTAFYFNPLSQSNKNLYIIMIIIFRFIIKILFYPSCYHWCFSSFLRLSTSNWRSYRHLLGRKIIFQGDLPQWGCLLLFLRVGCPGLPSCDDILEHLGHLWQFYPCISHTPSSTLQYYLQSTSTKYCFSISHDILTCLILSKT